MQAMKKSNGCPMNKVALFLNGQAPKEIPNLAQFSKIYCTDGAYNYLISKGIRPDVVSGDFDSIGPQEVDAGIKVIETPNQDFTDFEKALQILVAEKVDEVFVYGSSGMEHDHFLGNLSTALKYKNQLSLVFFDDYSYYFFAEKETFLDGYQGRIISLYPYPMAKGVQTKGLKYTLNQEDLSIDGRIGIRNKAISDEVEIKFNEGNLLLFIQKEDQRILPA